MPDQLTRVFHRLDIKGWRPVLSNEILWADWRKVSRLKSRDARIVEQAAKLAGIPLVRFPKSVERSARKKGISLDLLTCRPHPIKRRVVFEVHGRTYAHSKQRPDSDAILKSGLDALTDAGLLVDDSDEWCDWEKPIFEVGPKRTVILLEDLT